MERRVDVERLRAALDAERKERGLSWRQVATEADVSSSLFTRIGKGHSPDLESFAALVQWLGVAADQFMHAADQGLPVGRQQPLGAEMALLLRNRGDLTPADQEYMLDLINATAKYLKQRRET
ncbi:MAG: helix-turn-helix domain-containing protein [Pseudonocardia sp.]